MEDISVKKANLLWTGGWDSTFQLLQLLLVHRVPVTTYYLIHPEKRRSTWMELRTIQRLKNHLWEKYPHTRDLLKSTHYFAVDDIAEDAEITKAFQSVYSEIRIGKQNEWIARFCKEHQIMDMQIGIHHFDNSRRRCEEFILEKKEGTQTRFFLDSKFENRDTYILYRCFSFPLFRFTKMKMYETACEQNILDTMKMTWFCHTPEIDLKPCGKCGPCTDAIKAGLGWRISTKRRFVSFFYKRTIRPLIHPVFHPIVSFARIILIRLGLFKYVKRYP